MKKLSLTFLLIILIFSNSVFAKDTSKEYLKKCQIEINSDFTIMDITTDDLKKKHIERSTFDINDDCMSGFKKLSQLSDYVLKLNLAKAIEVNKFYAKFSIININK
jgi:hypothetical protein